MNILVTGGAGYIGSHTVVELLAAGHDVVIIDNLSNSSEVVIDRIEQISGKCPTFHNIDICDSSALKSKLSDYKFDAVIHFAALKSVEESVNKPLQYYENNVGGLLSLLDYVDSTSIKKIVFSSSATVYGEPEKVPIKESYRIGIGITNPYGQTKVMCEQILKDLTYAKPEIAVTLLRYFNPIGAHQSGLIGEDPNDTPNNLLPYVSQVAVGKLKKVHVFGNDYDTKDGTGVRDYIHVVDLAKGHLAALLHSPLPGQPDIYNLGTGAGYSVFEIINEFSNASGIEVPYQISPRRSGDIATCYADPSKAKQELKWTAKKTLSQMCEDAWRWQSSNPSGYTHQ